MLGGCFTSAPHAVACTGHAARMQGSSDHPCGWVHEERRGWKAWIGRGRDPSIPPTWRAARATHRRKMAPMLGMDFRSDTVSIITFKSPWSYHWCKRPRVGDRAPSTADFLQTKFVCRVCLHFGGFLADFSADKVCLQSLSVRTSCVDKLCLQKLLTNFVCRTC